MGYRISNIIGPLVASEKFVHSGEVKIKFINACFSRTGTFPDNICYGMRHIGIIFHVTFMTKASGQSLKAIFIGIALRTPNALASYEQDATTPRSPPPMITGFFSNTEFLSRSQETKNVSKSICAIALSM